jgi:putative heme-binding domain-containing protein
MVYSTKEMCLKKIESGQITLGEMNLDLERARALLFSDDPSIKARAEALFSDLGVQTRAEAIAQMRPALDKTGDPDSGRSFYQILCAQCHRFKDLGVPVGPDSLGIVHKSDEQILYDILDPNAAVETRYLSSNIETREGEIITGIITSESDDEITLLGINGMEKIVPRGAIRKLHSSGLSIMPEGLEAGLDTEDMADLLAFLQSE